jgi:hypothetical protein
LEGAPVELSAPLVDELPDVESAGSDPLVVEPAGTDSVVEPVSPLRWCLKPLRLR